MMADTKEFKELFNQSGIPKRLIISFPSLSVTLRNEDIVEESMEITERICTASELRFGSCEASVFKIRIIGNIIPLIGETFTVSMYVGDIVKPFVLGTYKVASDKPTADRKYRDIVAYDAMNDIINADVSAWYNGILPNKDSTTTLRAFRDSFMEHFGVEQEEITLPNDEMIVERTIDPEAISGKDVLAAICEINGCFAHIGRNGKMQYVFLPEIITGLYPSDELYPAEDLFPRDVGGTERIPQHAYTSCKYEDYTTKRIGKLQIRQEENDIGCIIGEGENCYIVQDNFLVYGKDAAALEAIGQKLFDIIGVIWYRPAAVQAIGNPCLEVGAGIRVVTQYEVVETYILERTLTGIHALSDSYEAQGVENYSEDANGLQKQILELKGKTNTLIRTVDETRSTIKDVEKDLMSEITQLSNEITLRVTSGEVQSMIDVTLDSIVLEAEQINLNGYVSAGDGNFTIDENGNLKIIGPYGTVDIENGVRVSSSLSGNDYTTCYSANVIWFRVGGSAKARIMYDITDDSLSIDNLGDGTVMIDGGIPITTANKDEYIGTVLNSSDTRISYTSVGNINIMSASGYKAENDYKFGNIASTGWVQGKVATLNDAINKLFNDFAAFDQRLSTLEAKVV